MSDSTTPWAYRFAGFELRPHARQLLGPRGEIELQAKVYELLRYLLEHAGHAVDKNAILDAVWPRQSVSEAALARCMMKLRRALDDDASEARLIQTLHGHGYRLAVTVERVASADTTGAATPAVDAPAVSPESAPSSSAAHAHPRAYRIPWTPLAALLAIGLLALVLWREHDPPAAADARPLRLAVLPIENLSGDASLDWAGLALMGAIGEVLHYGDGIAVLAASQVLTMQSTLQNLSPTEQRDWLQDSAGVSHLLHGKLRQQPGQLQLSYQLIGPDGDTRKRSVVGRDVPALAHAAGADLRAVLGAQRSGQAIADDAFANEAYLRGRALRLQGDVRGAAELFELAAQQAPQAFWPRFEWALCQRDLGQSSAAGSALENLLVEADAQPALEPQLSVRNALAILHWRGGRYAEAEQRLQEALALAERKNDPDRLASVLTNLGILADYRDQPERAREYLNRATSMAIASGQDRPPGHIHHTLAQIEIGAGNLAAAEQHLLAALDQFRRVGERRFEATTLNSLSRLRRRQGDLAGARSLIDQALAMHRELGNRGGEASALLASASIEAERGAIAAAIELSQASLEVARAIEESPRIALALRQQAVLQRSRGDYPAAIALLQQAEAIFAADGDHGGQRRSQLDIAETRRQQGELDAAETLLAALAPAMPDRADLDHDVALIRARLARDRGDSDAAWHWLQASPKAQSPMDSADRIEIEFLAAELELSAGQADRAAGRLAALDASTQRRSEWWALQARIAAAAGDLDLALAHERQARNLAGERWLEADAERLRQREIAAAD